MSHNVLAFIIVWIVAVSFGIEYFNTANGSGCRFFINEEFIGGYIPPDKIKGLLK